MDTEQDTGSSGMTLELGLKKDTEQTWKEHKQDCSIFCGL